MKNGASTNDGDLDDDIGRLGWPVSVVGRAVLEPYAWLELCTAGGIAESECD